MEKVSITVTRIMAATPEMVFNAWLTPDLLKKWMFGSSVRDEAIVSLENDPVAGGCFSYIVKRNGEVINHVGKYLVVKPFSHLSFTWGIEEVSVDESTVTIDLSPAEGGCRLVLTHELPVAWKDYADRTQHGWTFMLGKLNGVYLAENDIPRVTAQLLIRKPAMEVYTAFADPAITANFWFTKGSGILKTGKAVTWDWEMYGVSTVVYVKEMIPGKKIAIDWDVPSTCVDFEFRDLGDATTYVVITQYGFNATGNQLMKIISDTAGGFTTVLDGLKAYLEHGINLNLIADKFPENAVQHGK